MGLRISTAARNAAGNALLALLNVGGAGTIEVRSGAQPATPGDAATGTLLATFTLPNPAFASMASGTAALGTVADTIAVASGTAGWFRMKANAGTAVIDGTVGTSGAQLNLDSVAITTGGTVSITTGSVTMPVGV